MIQLCYASHAKVPFDAAQLTQLLGIARKNNDSVGVSGLLLYENHSFVQVLEGETGMVMPLYEKIRKDPRHDRMLLIFKREIEVRSFGSWSMGFFHVDRKSVEELPGYHNFFTKGFSVAAFLNDADRVREVLLQFRDGQWRRHVAAA